MGVSLALASHWTPAGLITGERKLIVVETCKGMTGRWTKRIDPLKIPKDADETTTNGGEKEEYDSKL